MDDDALQFSWEDVAWSPDRPSILGVAGGGRDEADPGLWQIWLAGCVAGSAWFPGDLCTARPGVGDRVRHASICGARADSADAGTRLGAGRGRPHAGGGRMADFLSRHPAARALGIAVWGAALQCARHG